MFIYCFSLQYLLFRKKPIRVEVPRNNKLQFKNFDKQQKLPFCIYADTEAYLIPKSEFNQKEIKESKNDGGGGDSDLCLEQLQKFFNYTDIDTDMDMGVSFDDDNDYSSDEQDDNDNDNDTAEGDEEEKISTIPLDVYQHPWSSKQLKITTGQDIENAIDRLESKSGVLNKHRMASYAVTVVCPPHLQNRFKPVYLYRGERAEEHFVALLAWLQEQIESLFETEGRKTMIPLTTEQQEKYNSSKTCHICEQEITYEKNMNEWQTQLQKLKEKNPPIGELPDGTPVFNPKFRFYFKSETDRLGPAVADHDHWTGDFRGS